jgi:dTDP-4-dehydrorhamnose reductase
VKIFVTGATGQLGRAVSESQAGRHEILAVTRSDLDIADHAAVMASIRRARPDAIINCAAYNRVDAAEDKPVAALDVNAFAVGSLARAAESVRAMLVHYGTDFVFDGETSRPYTEEDQANPRSTYAASKLIGEWFALELPRAYVLRVESLFGGPSGKSSIDRIINAIREGREVAIFTDRTVSPSYVVDVAAVTIGLLEKESAPGLYHCVNSGYCSWHDLARHVARLLGRSAEVKLKPISVAEIPMRAQRPRFAALDNLKLARAGFPMPTWQSALERYLARR